MVGVPTDLVLLLAEYLLVVERLQEEHCHPVQSQEEVVISQEMHQAAAQKVAAHLFAAQQSGPVGWLVVVDFEHNRKIFVDLLVQFG